MLRDCRDQWQKKQNMLPTSLSSLLTMWSCDVPVCVVFFFELFSPLDVTRSDESSSRSDESSSRRSGASTARQLVRLQTLALIYQASMPVFSWPNKNINALLILNSPGRWWSSVVFVRIQSCWKYTIDPVIDHPCPKKKSAIWLENRNVRMQMTVWTNWRRFIN